MRAGNVPDCKGHRHDSEAKGQGDANKPDSQSGICGGNDRAATTRECKPKSTKKFSNHARAKVHS
jgi:hypothetical protein